MKRLFAVRDFLVYLILTVLCVLAGVYLIDIWQGSHLSAVPDHDYTSEIHDLRHHGKVGEALAICNYVKSQPGMPNHDAIMVGHARLGFDIIANGQRFPNLAVMPEVVDLTCVIMVGHGAQMAPLPDVDEVN